MTAATQVARMREESRRLTGGAYTPLDWIIDYEDTNHQTLFAMGKADAERALAQRQAS